MKQLRNRVIMVVLTAMVMLVGCGETATSMRCRYKVGDVEKVRFASSLEKKLWVEMPDKEPSKPGLNIRTREILMRRQVESVDEGGNAIMEVTFEKVSLSVMSDTEGKGGKRSVTKKKYTSSASGTKSDWAGEPKLAGASFKIKIAPDTTVLEIIGLGDLRAKLNIQKTDEGPVVALLDSDRLKAYNQCDFVRYGREDVVGGDIYSKNLPLPNSMIKAQAIKQIYQVSKSSAIGANLLKVETTGEALFVLPEGMEKPVEVNDFRQALIKNMSDMQELNITGQGIFDLGAGKVLKADNQLECVLMLDGDKIGAMAGREPAVKGASGLMFTSIKLTQKYEVVE